MKREVWIRIACCLLAVLCLSGCSGQPNTIPTSSNTAEVPSNSAPTGQTNSTTTLPSDPSLGAPEPTVPNPTVSAPTLPEPTFPEPTQPTEPPVIVVTSGDALALLAAGNTLQGGDRICLVEDMEITEPVVFTVPVTLLVEAQVLCTEPILFETYGEGVIEICLAEGLSADGVDIRFDAPNCDVWWLENEPFGSDALAAAMTNVRTYNGVDLRQLYGLGGTGSREILSFTAGENNSLAWNLEGNVLYLAVSYLISDDVLENAAVQITTTDGEILTETMDLTAGERYYALTDASGEQRCYRIITQRVTYQLPVFYIEIENDQEVTSREEYLNATLRVDTATAAGDLPELPTTEILIRGRGHYSWNFDKKPYKIRFEKKTSVLGLAASKNWTLISNYTDRSLIQNYVAMEMGKVMDNIPYHSTQYPVDVFVNGEYRGVYTFGEQLEAKKERIDLEENSTDPDTDYLLEVGGSDEGDVLNVDYFHAGTLRHVAIKHPESDSLTPEQLSFLISYVRAADEAVRTLTDYEDYIDVDSLIDWVIIHELTYNLDCCFRRSCYLIKEKGGKLKMGPIWDFDLAFGSFYRYQSGDWATIGSEDGYVRITWMNYLKEDEAFMTRLTQRWNEVKDELLETALNAVEEMGVLVAPSAKMNFEVWNILGQYVPSQPAGHSQYTTYEAMIQRLRTFIEDRYDWLDQELNG